MAHNEDSASYSSYELADLELYMLAPPKQPTFIASADTALARFWNYGNCALWQ